MSGVKIIKDESELPTPPSALWQYFIRSISDPTLLIEGHTGEVFQRKDGARWQFPAIERSAKIDYAGGTTNWEPLTQRAAWFDDAEYPYTKKAVAA